MKINANVKSVIQALLACNVLMTFVWLISGLVWAIFPEAFVSEFLYKYSCLALVNYSVVTLLLSGLGYVNILLYLLFLIEIVIHILCVIKIKRDGNLLFPILSCAIYSLDYAYTAVRTISCVLIYNDLNIGCFMYSLIFDVIILFVFAFYFVEQRKIHLNQTKNRA